MAAVSNLPAYPAMPSLVCTTTEFRETSDSLLLRNYAEHRDQRAFTAFVERHLDAVYSTALRRLSGDSHLAQDVTQQVFTATARKAASLATHRVLSGWLYISTCFAAAKAVRAEQRRRHYETASYVMSSLIHVPVLDAEWREVRPVLDHALGALNTSDREALLLRYFESCSFPQIAARLDLTENAARMRVEQALEKLRLRLVKHGIRSTSGALTAALTAHMVSAAPAGMVGAIVGGATSALAASSSTVAVFGWITTPKLSFVSAALILGTAAVEIQREKQQQAILEQEQNRLRREIDTAAIPPAQRAALTQIANEVAQFRRDEAELERLESKARALRQHLASRITNATLTTTTAPANRPKLGTVPLADLDQLPIPKVQTRPVYPQELSAAGVTAR